MSGIVAIGKANESKLADKALEKIAHRGSNGRLIMESATGTNCQVTASALRVDLETATGSGVVLDGSIHNWSTLSPHSRTVYHALEWLHSERGPDFVSELDGPFAVCIAGSGGCSRRGTGSAYRPCTRASTAASHVSPRRRRR